MSRNMNKLHLNILDAFSYRKQLFELLEYSYNQRLYIYIYTFYFLRKIHKQVGIVKRRLFLKVSEAQSTGLRRRRLLLETAARWRCVLTH